VRPYRRRILAAALALVVAAGSVLAIGQGLKLVIDRGIAAGNPGMLNEALVGLLAVIVVMSGATFGRFYLVTWLGERVTADLRRAVFDHILKLSPAFFEVTRTGEVNGITVVDDYGHHPVEIATTLKAACDLFNLFCWQTGRSESSQAFFDVVYFVKNLIKTKNR
jgi:ABC-type multidrug transport system fused ATPase/permease subunit